MPFYWRGYEWERGKPNHGYTERVVAWCQEHGIVCKGHPLVWDHPASSPEWLPDDFAEIERLSIQRVRDIVRRFAGRIDIWDVVNEPTHLGLNNPHNTKMAAWGARLGAVAYTALHLKVARAANPKATLLVNDYRTDDAYLRILQQLKDEQGRWLFDVVGIQSHMHERVGRDDAKVAFMADESPLVKGFRVNDGAPDIGEDEELVGKAHVVAVRTEPETDDALAHQALLKRLNHFVAKCHLPNPSVIFDAHKLSPLCLNWLPR